MMLSTKLRPVLLAPALLIPAGIAQIDRPAPEKKDRVQSYDADYAAPTICTHLDQDRLLLAVDAEREFYCAILLSLHPDVLADKGILRDACVVAAGKSRQTEYLADLKLPAFMPDRFYVQTMTVWDADVRFGPVTTIDANLDRLPPPIPSDQKKTVLTDAMQEADAQRRLRDSRIPEYLDPEIQRVQCSVLVAESNPPQDFLEATFVANSDGYELELFNITGEDGSIDVRVILKTPGPGEGMLDVVERHSLIIPLGTEGGTVRVLIAKRAGGPLEDRAFDADEWTELQWFERCKMKFGSSDGSDDASGDASDDDDLRDLDRIQCELAIGGEVPSHFLRASFVAHSDSYRLLVAMVRPSTSEGVTDVYLILKTPGKGEGTRDVVEYHDLAVPLGRLEDGEIVRVLATEIVGPLPENLDEIVEDLAFETKAELKVGG